MLIKTFTDKYLASLPMVSELKKRNPILRVNNNIEINKSIVH